MSSHNLGKFLQACIKSDYKLLNEFLNDEEWIKNAKDDKARTPLHYAVYSNNLKAIKSIICREGVDINARDYKGLTPLHFARDLTNQSLIRKFLSYPEIELNPQCNNGFTPLHLAVYRGNESFAKEMLKIAIVPVNTAANDGSSALHIAAAKNNETIVKALLSRSDIDPNVRDNNGNTPLSLARDNKNIQICELLIYKDAKLEEQDYTEFKKDIELFENLIYYGEKVAEIKQAINLINFDIELIVECLEDVNFSCKLKTELKKLFNTYCTKPINNSLIAILNDLGVRKFIGEYKYCSENPNLDSTINNLIQEIKAIQTRPEIVLQFLSDNHVSYSGLIKMLNSREPKDVYNLFYFQLLKKPYLVQEDIEIISKNKELRDLITGKTSLAIKNKAPGLEKLLLVDSNKNDARGEKTKIPRDFGELLNNFISASPEATMQKYYQNNEAFAKLCEFIDSLITTTKAVITNSLSESEKTKYLQNFVNKFATEFIKQNNLTSELEKYNLLADSNNIKENLETNSEEISNNKTSVTGKRNPEKEDGSENNSTNSCKKQAIDYISENNPALATSRSRENSYPENPPETEITNELNNQHNLEANNHDIQKAADALLELHDAENSQQQAPLGDCQDGGEFYESV